MPPETAHNMAIAIIKNGLFPRFPARFYNNLRNIVFGIPFSNPIGLAAGFDKNGETTANIFKYGFGFAEIGTVTPLPQVGNHLPRLFRLDDDMAIINRMGFNNHGAERVIANLKDVPKRGIIGFNIGKNKVTVDPLADYGKILPMIYDWCDYITVNISSPNTAGLRDLQGREMLDELLSLVISKRNALNVEHSNYRPVLVKIAPDLDANQLEDIAELLISHNVDGVIISNTTISRPDDLKSKAKNEIGGLSGKPLFTMSTHLLYDFYKLTSGRIPIIGVGGIFNGYDAYEKIKSGASLVQIYSGMIYEGMGIVEKSKRQLSKLLQQDGFMSVSEAIGVYHK